jgi:hypothetical protein
MDERREMDEFENHGQLDVTWRNISGGSSGQERERWPQSLTTAAAGVGDITFDGRIKRARLLADPFLDSIKVGVNQLDSMLHFPGSDIPES